VLSEELAGKLFGTADPIGKTVMRYIGDTTALMVTGIVKAPENSHLQFEALVPFSTIYNPRMSQNWGGNWLTTYLVLDNNVNVAAMEKKFPAYLKRHMAENDRWRFYELFLQPLADVHAGSTNITHDYLNAQKFDRRYTYIFSIIAIIILVIACINFMNLSTARSSERAREVGVRKAIGARRFQLGWQFMGESILLSLLALAFALLLAWLVLPWVADFSDRNIRLPLFTNFYMLPLIIAGTVLVGMLAGLYPAGYLSSFEPVKVLKGSPHTGRNRGALRNVLVVGQFTAAVFLIIATIFAMKQLRFMQTRDRGFNGEQVMLIRLDGDTNGKYETMKQEMLGNSLVGGVSASQQRLGGNIHQSGVVFHSGNGPRRELTSSGVVVDKDYLRVYKIPIVAGADFSADAAGNAREYVINETLARELLKDGKKGAGVESLIGKMFGYGGMDSTGRIVGVAKDFNFNSLHHKIETLMMFNQKDWGYGEISVRINGNRAKEAVAFVEGVWNRHVTGHPFKYSFLDEHFANMYKADQQVSTVVGVLAGLAIVISCLGLFGLASFAAERRIKEIGIRKVLGASVQNIVMMLSRDFVKLVIVANLIAWPLAWFGVSTWLQDFAYRIGISGWVFMMAGFIALAIALCTISFQAIRAGRMNPVQSLKSD
jgi:putative ABC transport system permease protein